MNPLLFGFLLNRAMGQDNQTAARNAIIGGVVSNATSGIANPVAKAIVSSELSSRIKTGQPASSEDLQKAALRGAIRNLATPTTDTYEG